MKYITVLDFEVGKVFQYEVYLNQIEEHEEYIIEKGHNLQNCEWMVHKDSEIIKDNV